MDLLAKLDQMQDGIDVIISETAGLSIVQKTPVSVLNTSRISKSERILLITNKIGTLARAIQDDLEKLREELTKEEEQ